MLTLGNNTTTDFTRSIILMTSNVGSREMTDLLERHPIGFRETDASETAAKPSVGETALTAARAVFPLEFLNRFDETLVYQALAPEHLATIFDKFLHDIHDRALRQAGVPLLVKVSPEAKAHLVTRGTDLRYGARPLRRTMEKAIVDPISRWIASYKLTAGDIVEIELEAETLRFYRRRRSSDVELVV